MDSFLSLLQFADGLFPAGAYAHSFGLEYLVQCGEISGAAGVEDFLRTYLENSDLSLLQFADGLFPAGAYAHSFGLEYLVQCGEISGAAGVEDFLRTYLEN